MPIKLADLTKRTKTVSVRFEGADDALSVTYRPRLLTPALQATFQEAAREGRHSEMLVDSMVALVTDWDLLGDDGKPIPLTSEALLGVPIEVLALVTEALGRDLVPDPLPNGGSDAGSSLAGT